MTRNLIDRFIDQYQETVQHLTQKMHWTASPIEAEIATFGSHALYQGITSADRVYFTPGTMLMLSEKLAHYEETTQHLLRHISTFQIAQAVEHMFTAQSYWLLFPKPLIINHKGYDLSPPIGAFFCMMPSRYLATGKDTIFLYLIEEERATIYDVLELNHQQQTWCYQYPYHRCPLEKCFVDEITHHIQLCAVCETTLTNWVQIFSLSAIIAGQYLAVQRYEERRETSIHSRPRARNEKKSKRFVSTHTYKVIDANEILIPLHPADEDHIHHSETEKEGRFSWVAQAYVEGDLDRRVITTRPFTRTYRSERYVNVRGQTQDFPEGIIRQQPIRKSRQGKRITKVKASDYEEE